MELTLESAVSADSILGHLAYVVLIASMLMRTLLWLRVLVIGSALLGIAYASVILNDPVSTFWESCLVAVNILQLLRSHWRSIRARFSAAEQSFVSRHLPDLSRGEARMLLDAGRWVHLGQGDLMTVEGEPVRHLHYIAEGRAEVLHRGSLVASCGPGTFVGEMRVAIAGPATATVQADGQVKAWRIDGDDLRALLARKGEIPRALDAAFARNYRAKLIQMNHLVATGALPA